MATVTLARETQEFENRFRSEIHRLEGETTRRHSRLQNIPTGGGVNLYEIQDLKEEINGIEGEIKRLWDNLAGELRAIYERNKAVAPTLEELGRLRGQVLTEVESRYFRCGGWAQKEDGSWGAYFCKNCGWVADTCHLDPFGYNCCRICGSYALK